MWLLALAVVGVAGVFLTLVWFVRPSTHAVETVPPADAVVLFAGATDRLDTAVELMENGAAPSLVIPNGTDIEDAEDLCEGDASFEVVCPITDEVTTEGEARAIGRIAGERGWSSVIAVTSVYHVHRATFLLGRCLTAQSMWSHRQEILVWGTWSTRSHMNGPDSWPLWCSNPRAEQILRQRREADRN